VNSDTNKFELQATAVKYYSKLDEAAFFGWLDKIECVTEYFGRGRILYIQVDKSRVDESSLIELLALFYRYGVEMSQIMDIRLPEFDEWLNDEKAFWYEGVFKRHLAGL